jgi:hypothetical protein
MSKREISQGKTYEYALIMNTFKLGAVFALAVLLVYVWLITDTRKALNEQQEWYSKHVNTEMNRLIENISVSGVGTDSIILNIDGEEHIYSYNFMPEQVSEDFGRTKTYEFYQQITSATAPQTKLNRVADAYTDNQGYRKILDYYLVAMGSYYGSIGDIFEVELDTGRIILVIKGDTKADKDTDATNRYQASDLSVLEFICDRDVFKGNPTTRFKGGITNIRLIGHYDF